MHKMGYRNDQRLRFNRPSDKKLDEYYECAVEYFLALNKSFRPIKQLFESDAPSSVVGRHRGADGGHLLFRPIGLEIFTRVAIRYATQREISIDVAVGHMKGLPTSLSGTPLRGVLWDPDRRTVVVKGKRLAVHLYAYMLGLPEEKEKLLADYRLATERKLALPRVI